MSDTVIQVENLRKQYRIRHQAERQRYTALRDVLADRTKSAWRKALAAFRSPFDVQSSKFNVQSSSFSPVASGLLVSAPPLDTRHPTLVTPWKIFGP